MRKNICITVLTVLFAAFFSSCISTHVGNMSGSAALSEPNFSYEQQNISGEATSSYFLGILGGFGQSLVAEAKKDMLEKHPLQRNQALANVSVSYKTTYFLGYIVVTVKCIVTADIVEFSSLSSENVIQQQKGDHQNETKNINIGEDNQAESNQESIPMTDTIKIGDTVRVVKYFSQPVEAVVKNIHDGNYTIEYTKKNGKIKQVEVLGFQVERIK